MGLLLLKDRDGSYRRTWYAALDINGKRTSRSLKLPVRGTIPLDETGTFSLSLQGDKRFEASKAEALAKLDKLAEKIRDNALKAREAADASGVQRIRLSEWADKNAQRRKYDISDGNKYNKSVYDILQHFAEWVKRGDYPSPARPYVYLTDIDRELVAAYYASLASVYSWQTFRKYVFILKSVFDFFTNGKLENHFVKIYDEEYKGRKSAIADKSEFTHKPPTDSEMGRIWTAAKEQTDKPYLYRLMVLATCSGLRIGDCCTLTWDRIDMIKRILNVRTSKTKTDVAIPIFDYRASERDYHPIFGELRRELEAALAEREDGNFYVIPEAAKIYAENPSRIHREGKIIFARALAPKEEIEEAVLIGDQEPHKSPSEILKMIDESSFAAQKKERVRATYELYVAGHSYSAIAASVGGTKGRVSEDLAAVEELTGIKLRKGISHPNATRLTKLLKNTRAERKQGVRSACLYGWHSCRMYFVVAARRAGIDAETLKKITGHATVRMVEHYNNADKVEAANALREQMSHSAAKAQPTRLPAERPQEPSLAATIQAILANPDLTPEARNAAILALTAK